METNVVSKVLPSKVISNRNILNKIKERINTNTYNEEKQANKDNMVDSIKKAHTEWISAIANFEQADHEELVDYYIYKIKACQIRYNFLLKKAKEMGINM